MIIWDRNIVYTKDMRKAYRILSEVPKVREQLEDPGHSDDNIQTNLKYTRTDGCKTGSPEYTASIFSKKEGTSLLQNVSNHLPTTRYHYPEDHNVFCITNNTISSSA
jgi:hypothetical protein